MCLDFTAGLWRGNEEKLYIYVMSGRVEITSAEMVGFVRDSSGGAEMMTVPGKPEEDSVVFDLSELLVGDQYFDVRELFYEAACDEMYSEPAFGWLLRPGEDSFPDPCPEPGGTGAGE